MRAINHSFAHTQYVGWQTQLTMADAKTDESLMDTDYASEKKSDGPIWEQNVRDIELPPSVSIKWSMSLIRRNSFLKRFRSLGCMVNVANP